MFRIGANRVQSKVIRWKFPKGKELWELGDKNEWQTLENFLDSHGVDDFYVEDEAAERCLAYLRNRFDTSADSDGWGIVHWFVGNFGGDNIPLLMRLLALGVDPDLVNQSNCDRPSHLCSCWGWMGCARAIGFCRPSLTAENADGETPRAAADSTYPNHPTFPFSLQEPQLQLRRPGVLKIWKELEESGFPSLAKMASEEQWWAVKNLCRRRVISPNEALEKYNGKTALEWALAFQETRMAQELRYFFSNLRPPPSDKPDGGNGLEAKLGHLEASFSSLSEDMKKVSDSTTSAISNVAAEATKQQELVTEYLSQLRAELTELREEMKEEKMKVTTKLEAVDAEVQKIIDRAAVSRSGNIPEDAGGCARKNPDKALSEDLVGGNRAVSYLLKKVQSAAYGSPAFVARLADLLEEHENNPHQ